MAFLFFEITKMNLVQGVGINDKDDYAPVCVECLVTARVMTEWGV